MIKQIKSKLNFELTKRQKGDSKFRITHIHTTNDTYNELAFGNNFNILTKIRPDLGVTFTIIDEIDDKIILAYDEKTTTNIVGFNTSYTKYETKYHAFNKNEFLKQITYLKNQNPSQQSWDEVISEWSWEPLDCPRIHFRFMSD